jgi:enoyl-CoA hydratase/carnithine racemase
MSDHVLVEQEGAVLIATLNRPEKHNALTPQMMAQLGEVCEQADADPTVRVLLFRGAGGRAFAAGADISYLTGIKSGEDGIAYEQRVVDLMTSIESVRVPTVAAIAGICVGGGLEIAASCDIRLATPSARFGVPIARTVGNTLSMHAIALLVTHLGPSRTADMLLRAKLVGADTVLAAGFLTEICPEDKLDERSRQIATEVAGNAPLTMWAIKESIRRMRVAQLPSCDDLVRTVYGSDDFNAGVAAFVAGHRAQWTGR